MDSGATGFANGLEARQLREVKGLPEVTRLSLWTWIGCQEPRLCITPHPPVLSASCLPGPHTGEQRTRTQALGPHGHVPPAPPALCGFPWDLL